MKAHVSDLPFTPRPLPSGFPSHVVLPDTTGFSLAAIPGLVEAALGTSSTPSPLANRLGCSATRVVLLVLDGLGFRALQELWDAGEAPALRALVERGSALPITSVFPATTVTALTTLASGLHPISHGMIGYRLYLREASSITNMIRFSLVGSDIAGSAIPAGLDPYTLLPSDTVHQRLHSAGIDTHGLLPQYIAGSGLSTILYRGCAQMHAAASLDDMCVTARSILSASSGPAFLSLYWPGLDSVAHVRGPNSDAFHGELRSVDATIGRELVAHLSDTLLLITADHGFVSMASTDYTPFADMGELSESAVLPPTGEPRASYIYLRNSQKEEPHSDGPTVLPNGLLRLTTDELLASGLLGEGVPHPEIRNRLGDLALISTASGGILHPYPNAVRLPGMHGGLTEQEMIVPLIAASL